MKLILVIVVSLISRSVYSQDILQWKAHTSFRSIIGIEEDNTDKIWIATEGGVAVYNDTSIVKTMTIIDGLSRLGSTSIEYDPISNSIFIGYVDGMIDMIDADTYEVRQIEDINRNTIFASKSINKFFVSDDVLFVGTDFGIVEYDINTLLVNNSYLKLGNFDTGTTVNDLTRIGNILYVATIQGIAFSALDGNYEEAEWGNYDESTGLNNGSIEHIGIFNAEIVASSKNENYKLENGSWSINTTFSNNIIIDYSQKGSVSIALAEKNIFISDATGIDSRFISNKIATSLNGSDTENIIFGTLNDGIGIVNRPDFSIDYQAPNGPYQNFFQGLNVNNGTLISSSSQKSSGNGNIDRGKGYYIYDGEQWKNFNSYLNTELSTKGFQQAFTTTASDEYYYFGSWGRGVSTLNKETLEVRVFDETNSSLRGWPTDDPNYPVIIGLQTDSRDDVWIVSRFGGTPLYRQTPGDDDWQSFNESNSINSSDLYEGLFIDSFDQKWIPLQNDQPSGTGLLVLDTKDPSDETDDVGVKLQTGANSGNLPDNKVKAIIEDKNGEVWIGTERGIAKFIFPELIIDGSVQERTGQWLINEDTSAVSRFLLRDVNVSAMAVNAANEKWIGSTNQGIWVLNAEGSKIIKRFTSESSPLFSNNIISIAINDITGEVYIATDVGLMSFQDVPKKSVNEMKNLKVFPNPFSYTKNEQIFIEGLSDQSIIKVLGVDGTAVNSFETIGGRITWDGKDSNDNELGSGVYFVVAVDSEGNSKGVGKIIIVR